MRKLELFLERDVSDSHAWAHSKLLHYLTGQKHLWGLGCNCGTGIKQALSIWIEASSPGNL